MTESSTPPGSPSATPAVSIVLPVHNGERYLREALDSILVQTFTDFELIAVDDCSSDFSPQILADYAARDSRMKVLTLAKNAKLPGALNAGFREARGRWFTWTSDDNLLMPETIARLIDTAQAYADTDVLYADFHLIQDDGEPRGDVTVGEPDDLIFSNTIGCCFLYAREVDETVGGYDEALFGIEDYDFWLRVEAAGFRFHHIHAPLYIYRRHGQSLTDRRARHIRQLAVEVLEPRITALPESPRRARAWLELAMRDPYRVRPRFLWRALVDDPVVVARHWRDLLAWLKSCVRVRIG
ncbi:glycosyltransferase family 2 protein [Pseudoblastomonas halimionae]|uniref:Glycosyltransferase n=1 Tax=Alteriqipengyuania halimionae TaxID=1926630 RepID=A0A6I4U7J8_9SPHN|nr:glycosyltransferase [Alteriqipengyuania halimionae]MXP10351.1 glycosyltransferase [Alteriqipengyuania halimionae]